MKTKAEREIYTTTYNMNLKIFRAESSSEEIFLGKNTVRMVKGSSYTYGQHSIRYKDTESPCYTTETNSVYQLHSNSKMF